MRHLLGVILIGIVVVQTANLSTVVYPVAAQRQNQLQDAAIKTGIGDPGEKILTAVGIASKQTGLSQELILSLMYTESSLNIKAVSSKNYQGLMQIPHSNLLLHGEEDVNTLIGAKILLEKIALTQGDLRKAIVLYKGYPPASSKGLLHADKVLSLVRKLKEV